MATYVELAPPARMAAHVACLWASHDGAVRVLPDTCADIVFENGILVVAGPATRAFIATATPGHERVGVRFRIGAAGGALGLPALELLDEVVVLSELWGDAARRLQDDVAAQPSRQGRLRVLAAGVADRLPQSGDGDLLVRRAAQELMSGVSLTDTGRFVGVGERHLRRRFERAIGYGPATLVRIQRFQQFLGLADRHPGAAITRLAAEAGYADQAHLSRECRRLSELSPADLLAERPIAAGDKSVSFNTEPTEPATLAS